MSLAQPVVRTICLLQLAGERCVRGGCRARTTRRKAPGEARRHPREQMPAGRTGDRERTLAAALDDPRGRGRPSATRLLAARSVGELASGRETVRRYRWRDETLRRTLSFVAVQPPDNTFSTERTLIRSSVTCV